jgi:type VI protein secretion system component VasF
MAALIAIVVAMVAPAFTITTHSVLAFAVLVAVGEYFFHQYLLKADKVEP